MKIFKGSLLVGVICIITSSALWAQDAEIKRILAKYGIDQSAKPVAKAPVVYPTSKAGDLVTASPKKSNSVPSKEELQKTVQVGRELERAVESIDDQKLERVAEKDVEEDKIALQNSTKDAEDKQPGFFARIWGMIKIADAIANFNKKAVGNLARFKITFKNVCDSLVSFNDDKILKPEKDTQGNYMLDEKTEAIKWKLVINKLTTPELQSLKQECLYIIIKEMVDGFKHLDPVIGRGISALSFIAPQAAKQSVLVYEVATKFLPMLEKIAKENWESASEKSNPVSN